MTRRSSSSRLLRTQLVSREDGYPELESLRELLFEDRETEKRIERTVDEEGEVLDGASAELKRIRDRLRGAHARIVRQLEGFLQKVSERNQVSDASVTIRNGRYVVPVRREGKSEVRGILHDESQSGATLFVEPPMAIEMMMIIMKKIMMTMVIAMMLMKMVVMMMMMMIMITMVMLLLEI